MTITWQDLLTAFIVLLAGGYLARSVVRWAKRRGMPGCGCCPKCPAAPPEKPLVGLDHRRNG